MSAKPNWAATAMRKVTNMPDTAPEIVDAISEAIDKAIDLAAEGKKDKAREVAEKAVGMAFLIKC